MQCLCMQSIVNYLKNGIFIWIISFLIKPCHNFTSDGPLLDGPISSIPEPPPSPPAPVIRHPGTCSYQRSQSACTFKFLCYLAQGVPIEGCGGDYSVTCCMLQNFYSANIYQNNYQNNNQPPPPPPPPPLPPFAQHQQHPSYIHNQLNHHVHNYPRPSTIQTSSQLAPISAYQLVRPITPNIQQQLPPTQQQQQPYQSIYQSSTSNHRPSIENGLIKAPIQTNLIPVHVTSSAIIKPHAPISIQSSLPVSAPIATSPPPPPPPPPPPIHSQQLPPHVNQAIQSQPPPLQQSLPQQTLQSLQPQPNPISQYNSQYNNNNNNNNGYNVNSLPLNTPVYQQRRSFGKNYHTEVCGKPASKPRNRIIGGQDAYYGEFPWQVHIKISNHQCGGALVKNSFIVTAAHCIYQAPLDQLSVIIGAHDIEDSRYQENPPQYFRVSEVRLHPKFKFSASHPDRYDIALLRLDRPVIYSDSVSPVCLPPFMFNFEGWTGIVTGWGKTDPTLSNRYGTRLLQKVEVPVINNSDCEKWHQSQGIDLKINSEMMCAGYEHGQKDACVGDSGGPLVVSLYGYWTLAGITSAGFGCAQSRQPGIYHRVSHTVDWINANIGY